MQTKKPPNSLKQSGREWWRKVLLEFEIESTHDLERLALAGHCLDEISECNAVLKKEGRFMPDRYGTRKEHPAAKAAREWGTLFLRVCRELALDIEPPAEVRPPSRY